MKEGAWIIAANGQYSWITEHASWLQDANQARALELPEEAIARIKAIPWDFNGPGRVAICLEGMRHGLIRFWGHGASVTFESVLPMPEVLSGVTTFMAAFLGPFTDVCINRLDTGETWRGPYNDLQTWAVERKVIC